MIDLVARRSALYDKYYIDYKGMYHISDIAKALGLNMAAMEDIYKENGGVYHEERQVYYFDSFDKVKEVVDLLVKKVRPSAIERQISLTEEEVEYIRKALINEDSNVIFTKTSIRESIFKKLNR